MAERPVFLPKPTGSQLVETVSVSFIWHKGMSAAQKKRNVAAMHAAAAAIGISPVLETSSKSDFEVGRRLSAFYLPMRVDGQWTTVESAFQGSKVFEEGGPFIDLYHLPSREAKLDPRLKTSGRLVAFELEGKAYPLSPPTIFYDWLYVNALFPYREWLQRLSGFMGFTDIEFNPSRSINCQARAFALFFALEQRGLLDEAVQTFEIFAGFQESAYI